MVKFTDAPDEPKSASPYSVQPSPKPRVVKPSAKYCNIPLEYKFWIQELCANYISGFKGKAVKQGKTQRAIVHTTNLLTQLGGTL